MDLKGNPLDPDLQNQAGKCLNKKECRSCAEKVLQYIGIRKEEYEKEEAIKLKKKQTNDKAKAKKREKQAEKEREEKRLKRIENAQKRLTEKEQREKEINTNENNDNEKNNIKTEKQSEVEEEGFSMKKKRFSFLKLFRFILVSQLVDGILNGLLLSLMTLFTWQLYINRQQPINFRDFYKHV